MSALDDPDFDEVTAAGKRSIRHKHRVCLFMYYLMCSIVNVTGSRDP